MAFLVPVSYKTVSYKKKRVVEFRNLEVLRKNARTFVRAKICTNKVYLLSSDLCTQQPTLSYTWPYYRTISPWSSHSCTTEGRSWKTWNESNPVPTERSVNLQFSSSNTWFCRSQMSSSSSCCLRTAPTLAVMEFNCENHYFVQRKLTCFICLSWVILDKRIHQNISVYDIYVFLWVLQGCQWYPQGIWTSYFIRKIDQYFSSYQ